MAGIDELIEEMYQAKDTLPDLEERVFTLKAKKEKRERDLRVVTKRELVKTILQAEKSEGSRNRKFLDLIYAEDREWNMLSEELQVEEADLTRARMKWEIIREINKTYIAERG